MKNLNWPDVFGIFISWVGAGAVAYVAKNSFVALVCVASAFYLSKWIILKEEE